MINVPEDLEDYIEDAHEALLQYFNYDVLAFMLDDLTRLADYCLGQSQARAWEDEAARAIAKDLLRRLTSDGRFTYETDSVLAIDLACFFRVTLQAVSAVIATMAISGETIQVVSKRDI